MSEKHFDQEFFKKVLPEGVSITDIPVLAFKSHFVGHTDYLDSIYPKDMQYRVMRGVDYFRRPYLSFTWKDENGDENVQTFFQRYSDSITVWSHGKRDQSLS